MNGPVDFDLGEGLQTRTYDKVAPPTQYNVIIFDDEHTTIDFLFDLLTAVDGFNMSEGEAARIIQEIEENKQAVAGTYSKEIAETKVMVALQFSKAKGVSLKIECKKA